VNPFKSAFVVDAMVQFLGDEARAYMITDVRQIIPLGDDVDDASSEGSP
jgi:hypothetical protein